MLPVTEGNCSSAFSRQHNSERASSNAVALFSEEVERVQTYANGTFA